MHKDISPEEKLLSIIKGKQNIPESGVIAPEVKDAGPAPRAPWGRIDDYISAILKNDLLKNSILDAKTLMGFNKYAVIAAALIASYLILDAILVRPSRKAASFIAKTTLSKPFAPAAEKTMPVETRSYSFYSNRMSGKNVFGPGSPVQTEQAETSAEFTLGLVGIIPGASPQAIVEEKKSQRTYYLIKGQSINGITLEDIDEGKVVLEESGKRTTLFL